MTVEERLALARAKKREYAAQRKKEERRTLNQELIRREGEITSLTRDYLALSDCSGEDAVRLQSRILLAQRTRRSIQAKLEEV